MIINDMDRARNQMTYDAECMAVSTENATILKSTKSRNSKSSVQIQMKPKSEFKFAPRDTEKSEFLDLVDLAGVTISDSNFSGNCHSVRMEVGGDLSRLLSPIRAYMT